MSEINNYREQFPIFKSHPDLVYLDNSATTQKPNVVINAISDFYINKNANVHRGIYKLSENATTQYEKARSTVANFLNCSPNEIIFTSGTTDGLNKLALSLESYLDKLENLSIITTEFEHHSNFLPWQKLASKHNLKFELINVKSDLDLDYDQLRHKLIDLQPAIFATTGTSNVTGTIIDLKRITKIVREVSPNTLIILDAAQTVSHSQINLEELDVDFLAFSGHKIYGPTGIGVLYLNKQNHNFLEPGFLGGGMINKVTSKSATWAKSPEKFEAGTPNIAGAIGLASAIDFVTSIGLKTIFNHEVKLTKYALSKLKEIQGITIHSPTNENTNTTLLSFSTNLIHPHDLAQILDEEDIAIRAGHHCCQILHRDVLNVPATSRVSFAIYNDTNDVDRFINGLNSAIDIIKL